MWWNVNVYLFIGRGWLLTDSSHGAVLKPSLPHTRQQFVRRAHTSPDQTTDGLSEALLRYC